LLNPSSEEEEDR